MEFNWWISLVRLLLNVPTIPAGAVCESGAVPLPGLHLVAAWQEGKPQSGAVGPSHHFPVQRRDQPCHHFPPLPVLTQPRHFLPRLVPFLDPHLSEPVFGTRLASRLARQSGSQGARHRVVDRRRTGQDPDKSPQSSTTNVYVDLQSEQLCFSTGVQAAEELLVFESHPVRPAVQRRVPPQEDLGRCEQVCWCFQQASGLWLWESGLTYELNISFRESMTTFDHLCETFPDENCVLTNGEILVEVNMFFVLIHVRNLDWNITF